MGLRKTNFFAWVMFGLFSVQVAGSALAEQGPGVPSSSGEDSPALNLVLRMAQEDTVAFRGSANFDKAGVGSQSILYPAPNAAGLVAAIVTHGLIVESTKKSQKEKIQRDADEVLSPYQSVLTGFKNRELVRRGLKRIAGHSNRALLASIRATNGDWFVDVEPVFSMTQDRRALVLDNVISVFRPDSPALPSFRNSVRVVSKPRSEDGVAEVWSANQGEEIKEESARLLAESVSIALAAVTESANVTDGTYRTVRYREGGAEQMERGMLLSEDCERTVVKTLRNALLSVPSQCRY